MSDPLISALASLLPFVAGTVIGNGVMFVAAGGALHYAYYVRRADRAAEWRLQPDRPMPTLDELRAKLRSVAPNVVLFNVVVGVAFWAIAHGHSRIVFEAADYDAPMWVVTSLAPPVVFHVVAFALHRAAHTPFLFKHIHSVHHRARTPVFLDGLTMHPLEVVYSALALVAPAFLVPSHVVAFGVYIVLVGLHELFDHTGIRLTYFPFSPSAHHDEHHRSVQRCYGQTFPWIDALLGTGMRERGERARTVDGA